MALLGKLSQWIKAATPAAPSPASGSKAATTVVVAETVEAPAGFVAKSGQELQAARLAEAARLREQVLAANAAKPAGTTAPVLEHYASMPQVPATTAFYSALGPLGRFSRDVLFANVDASVASGKPFSIHAGTLDNVPIRERAAFAQAEAAARPVVEERRAMVAQWKENFDHQLMRNSYGAFMGQIDALTPGFEGLGRNVVDQLVSKARDTMVRVSGEPKVNAFTSFQDGLLDVLDHARSYGSPGQKATADAIVRSDDLPRRLTNIFLTLGRDGAAR